MDILVVDDSKAMRSIVVRAVKSAGLRAARFREASSGAEALAAVRAAAPDLILSDWHMPEMSGMELLRALRAGGYPVRFGFVTSEGDPGMHEEALANGALFVLTKPFTPEALKAALAGESGSILTPAEWLGALESAFAGLATRTLGFPAVAAGRRLDGPPPGMAGAYLGLVAPGGGVQVGLVSDEPGCAAVARGLLGLPPGENPGAPEVADAVCEVVNILAGAVKARLRDRGPMQMGLPAFFRGPVQPTERLGVVALEVRAGASPVALVVVHPRS